MAIEYTHPLRYKSGKELAPVLERNRIDLEEFLNSEVIRLDEDGTVDLPLGSEVGGSDIWHAGNDGAGSGLDSDTVDGSHLAAIIAACEGNVINVEHFSATGWTLPSGVLAEIYQTSFPTGLSGVTTVMLDVTMHVQVANLATAEFWGAQMEVQGVLRGQAMYHGGHTRPAHTHLTSASGTTSADGGHTPVGTVGGADGTHTHTFSESTSAQDAHAHGPGTLAAQSGGASTTGAASATSHTHSVPEDSVGGSTAIASGHSHTAGVLATSGTTTGSGGAAHTHSTPDHTHGVGGNTGDNGGHGHTVSGTTTTSGSGHGHTFSGNAVSAHNHTVTTSGSTGGAGSASVIDTIAVRWVGDVSTAADGTITLACWASASVTAALVERIQFNGQIWEIPSSIGGAGGGGTASWGTQFMLMGA